MKRYTCALCGDEAVAEEMIYSRHTGNRFCRSWAACEKRRKRRRNTPRVRAL